MANSDLPFLVFGQPSFGPEEKEEVLDSIAKAWIGTGPKVAQFEKEFSQYKGLPYAAAVHSATAGLHLACLALELQPQDEVITTPMTFCASVNAIVHAGLKPVLADVDPHTQNISPAEIERKITPRTRALMPVHFAGRPCEMDEIMAIAKKHNLYVIEDCAHAIETEYHGKKAGSFGTFGVFSFYATKNLSTGEGGMVLSRDEAKLQRIKRLALHGLSQDAWKRFSDSGYKHYDCVEIGFKYNMMDLQAALGIHQLKKLESFWQWRQKIWQTYMAELDGLPMVLPAPIPNNMRHGYHLFTVQIEEEKAKMTRDDFLNHMTAERLGVGVHYRSIPEHPVYREKFGWKTSDFPNAAKIGRRTVSLPLSPKMTPEDLKRVVQSIRKILK